MFLYHLGTLKQTISHFNGLGFIVKTCFSFDRIDLSPKLPEACGTGNIGFVFCAHTSSCVIALFKELHVNNSPFGYTIHITRKTTLHVVFS